MAPAPASLASASLAALRQAVVVARTARMKRRRRSSWAAPSLAAEANYHCWLLSVAAVPSLLVARTAQMKMRRMHLRKETISNISNMFKHFQFLQMLLLVKKTILSRKTKKCPIKTLALMNP